MASTEKALKAQGRAGFRIVAFDDGQGHRATAVLPPGYDWYKPGWEEDEIVHGRYRMYIPRDLPHGEYELRLAILDEVSGQVLPVEADQGVTSHVFAEGEWASPFTVTLMSSDEAHKEARSDLRLAMETLLQGQCEEGWETWKNAERHVMKREEWRNRQRVRVQEAMAGCWINAAVGASDRDGVVDYLTRAMKWDHNHPELPELTLPLADHEAEGKSLGTMATMNWPTFDGLKPWPWTPPVRGLAAAQKKREIADYALSDPETTHRLNCRLGPSIQTPRNRVPWGRHLSWKAKLRFEFGINRKKSEPFV